MVSGRFLGKGISVVACGVAVFLATVPAAGAPASEKLGPRYVDPVHGYSLCVPAGARRDLGPGVKRLARWVKRDAKTGAIAWQLTVRKAAGAGTEDMSALAKRLGAGLRGLPEVTVEKAVETRVAGLPGVETAVAQGRRGRRWQHELWARRGPGDILVLSISGALGLKAEMDELLAMTAGTWEIMDPKQLAELRKESLQRGRSLLEGLTAADLTRAAGGGEQWFLCRRGDEAIGFMRISPAPARDGSAVGVEVRTTARFGLPGGQSMAIRRVMTASADRAKEHWTESAKIVHGGKVIRQMSEQGACEAGLITCRVTTDGQSATRKKPLEPAAASSYLPRAFAVLLPRLVDLSKPASYGFATYTTAANAFDLRTFAVTGPATVTVNSRTHEAVQVTDQMAADAAPASMAVSKDGSLLRMTSDTGIVIEQSTRQAVLRRYPDAEK